MEKTTFPTCPSCGGKSYNDFNCKYCGVKNEKYETIINLIEPYKSIEKYYDEVLFKKLVGGIKLDEKNDKILNMFLKYNVITDDYLPDLVVIINTIQGKKNMSYDTFEIFIIRTVEKIMREQANSYKISNYVPRCYISNLNDTSGLAYEEFMIFIKEEDIKKLYNDASLNSLLAIYHESRHIIQKLAIKNEKFSSLMMSMIKDEILDLYFKDKDGNRKYYNENYDNISYEVDAYEFALISLSNLLNAIGMTLTDDFITSYEEKHIRNHHTNIRKVDDEYFELDDLFYEIIMDNPELLKTYPQLNIECKIVSGKVERKTRKELVDMLISGIYSVEVNDYIKFLLKKTLEQKRK